MNVLLVSADEQFVNILSFAISLKGHGVLIAKSPPEARAILNSSHEVIDAVAVDLMLVGGSNGLEIADKVVGFDLGIPVFLITPFQDPLLAKEARRCGCKDIILKTEAIDDLPKKLTSVDN